MSAARGTSRRSVLLAGGSVLAGIAVVGCTSAPDPPPPPPPPDPDDALRAAATAREQSLLQAYDAAALADPALATRLAPLRTQHAEHLAALTGPGPLPGARRSPVPTAVAPTVGATTATPTPPAPPTPPVAPAVALASLADAERSAAARHVEDALAAADRSLASLLAALAASEASHPVALG